MPQMQLKLRKFFDYLQVRQRLVLCAFALLAIVNAYSIRLCLDFSLSRIARDCNELAAVQLENAQRTWRKAPKANSDRAHGRYAANKVLAAINAFAAKFHPTANSPYAARNIRESRINQRARAGHKEKPARPTRQPRTTRQSRRVARNAPTPSYPRQKSGMSCETQVYQHPLRKPESITVTNSADIWTKEVQVLITISFYVGYMITHIPGGRLAERYGGKWILGASILSSGILTLLTPTIVRHGGPKSVMLLRMVIGLFEGPTFPAVSAMLAQWVPEKERGRLCSSVLSAGEIGIIFMHLVSGFTIDEQDWAVAFYVVGSGAILWFMGFVVVCYSKPDDSPYIQSSEREYIKSQVCETLETESGDANEVVPWSNMLMNAPIWALIASNMQHDWNQQEFAKELEQMLLDLEAKGKSYWNELETSIRLMAPHLYSWLASLTSGSFSDYLISEGILNRTQTRRLMSWLVFISVTMYFIHDKESSARPWSILAFGAYYAGIKLLPLDMSPNFAGTLMGITNGLGALPGLVLPVLEKLEEEYAIIGSIRATLWFICAGYISGEVQSYNQLEPTANRS
ncbi:uncharacterized protein Dmoj_GI14188 [Drosophila mojavensis]|uniref:Major facilitator superfamily (MFS) profile domain-containing protein n=1 Tax=Drosophila mojavensis TaxID=7230 RepID=B4KJR9_DROMO|nr:uncharacterized protein Dmoj_GI14188 [Drosophila mojavensis]